MRKISLFFTFVLFVIAVSAQINIKTNEPQPLSIKEQQLLMSLPDLVMPDSYKNKSIPYKVDHSESEHFRAMFVQAGMSCGQASSTGICFTYEMNAARGLPANINANLYPTGFVYNWDAGDWGSNGVSYYHTLEVLRMVGTPNQAEYGGTIDAGGNLRWMNGYDLYYSAMHNRISHAYKLNVGDADGLLVLKNWINDHLNGDDDGGCAVFYSGVPYPTLTLPAGTEDAGKFVLTEFYAGTSHSMAILGYNDSIRFDYNGDGKFTNNIDIDNDGEVTMADWEIGGVKMCNTYSGGPAWSNGGFCYIMYKNVADGSFWQDVVHVMKVNDTYEPLLTAKASVTYTKRKRIKVYAGISTNTSATFPEYVIDFPIFDYQAGDNYMTGGTAEADKTLEFGLDLTPLLNFITPGQSAKYFLQVNEVDIDGWGEGTINSFSVINYSTGSPVETASTNSVQTIPQNGTATMSIVCSESYNPVQITTSELSGGAIMSPFSQQLIAAGGTEPYTWGFDMDFTISEVAGTFPTGGTPLSGSGFFSVPLGFTFNFYGQEYSNIYVSNVGLVVFEPGFDDYLPYYHQDQTIFMHSKCIAPFFNSTITSNMKSISGSGFKTIIWDNITLDYAMTIYDDGRIEFFYNNSALTNLVNYVCGVNNGDEINYQWLHFDNPNSVSSGFSYNMVPFAIPDEFEISDNGLLTGVPTHEYLAEEFHFKVVDNNGIRDKAILPFVTDGLILGYHVNTPDDDIIEYAESITLDLEATNPMDYSMTGINVTLSTSDPYITVTDNNTACSDLVPDANEIIPNAFSFNVSAAVPDNHVFQLNFTVTSDQGTWDYFYLFTAYAPNIVPGDVVVDDANDDILAAGETADIRIPLLNSGGSDVHNLSITASTTDPYITLNTTLASIISLEPSDEVLTLFNITTASEVENQHIAEVLLTITGDNGYSEVIPVEVTINTAIITVINSFVDDGLNNCLDPGETANVLFNLKNAGLVGATNITATLSTADPLILINTSPIDVASLLAGSNTILTYNLSVDPTCNMAHLVELNLHISADNGLSTDVTYYMIIGILIENFESGGLESFEWIQSEAVDWFVVDNEAYEGAYSLRSGAIGNNAQTVLQVSMFVVMTSEISFACKVSSENYYDFLEFLVDGLVVVSWSGELPWTVYSYEVNTGPHTFAWRYRKDGSVIGGSDAAWIDNIVFPAVNNIPPMLNCEISDIFKTMDTNQEETNSMTISNLGGGISYFDIEIIPQPSVTKSIEGAYLESSLETFKPSQTYNITFTVHNVSADVEWLKNVTINFPDEITVNSSTDFDGPSGDLISDGTTGTGIDLVWSTTEMWGAIHDNESATATVNVTFDEDYTGLASEIAYTIFGDIYGADPHQVNSSITLTNKNLFWLCVDPYQGEIPYNSYYVLSLHYKTINMSEGIYYANMVISDLETTLTIPVELTVDSLSSSNLVKANKKLQIYPNPFNTEINIIYYSESQSAIDIRLYDITGKLVDIINTDFQILPGENKFYYNLSKEIQDGMYLVKITIDNEIYYCKIVKK